MIRRSDLRGEKEFNGAVCSMNERIVWREAAWNIERSFSPVIRRVFEGGEGCTNAGTDDKSMESGVREPLLDRLPGEEGAEVGTG